MRKSKVTRSNTRTVPWDADRRLQQLTLGEDSRVEFKEVFFDRGRVQGPRRERLANELAAFGNTVGGALIFSVSDRGALRRMDRRELDALESLIREVCADSIRPPLPFLTQRVAVSDGSFALVVEVGQSALVHKSPGGYLGRQGSSARELAPEALRRLFDQRGRSGRLGPDEEIIVGTGRNTLAPALVDRFISSRTRQADDAQLVKLGVVREDDENHLRATVAGILLCSERPDEHLSGAVIEAVRYAGHVLGRASQLDAATITGPLDRQIRDAVAFARRNTRVAARKEPGRVDMPQFGPRAVFEAIVNAVVHRDYSLNAKTRLFLFDDRLELYSPGALPNTLPIDALRHRQATRNETAASLLHMLEVGDVYGSGDRQYYLEQRGEGVPIIYEETLALTGTEPVYEMIGGAELRLTVPSARPPSAGIAGVVSVTTGGRPLAGATVLALYPNKTARCEETDTLGRAFFDFHSRLPITVFCAAAGHHAHVERDWRPPSPLQVDLVLLGGGGSSVFPARRGHLPALKGRLNPILDQHDRMYLYASNVAINEGMQQPVFFKLHEPLRLTDVNGAEWLVRFVDMIGDSSVLEYEPPAKL